MRISDWSSDVCSSDLTVGSGYRDQIQFDAQVLGKQLGHVGVVTVGLVVNVGGAIGRKVDNDAYLYNAVSLDLVQVAFGMRRERSHRHDRCKRQGACKDGHAALERVCKH